MSKKAKRKREQIESSGKTTELTARRIGFSLDRTIIYLPVIIAFGMLAYANTFSVPFQWDEEYFMVKNPIIKDLGYFTDFSKTAGLGKGYGEIILYLKSRYFSYLSFALNYRLHGFNVFGYHVVNLSIHILNALLLYFLVLLSLKAPFFKNRESLISPRMIAFFTGLIFAVHPIQTEAVTYIYQRTTAMVAFFYLLALVLYIKGRLATVKSEKLVVSSEKLGNSRFTIHDSRFTIIWYLLSLLSTVCAMKTKENAITLPFVIMLYEFFFFSDSFKNRMLRLLPFALTLAIIPLTLLDVHKPVGDIIGELGAVTARVGEKTSRMQYLFTEFRVIVTYLRLLFLPVGQNLVHFFPHSVSFAEPRVILSFLFLVSIAGLGVWFYFRSRRGAKELRLIAFGIFFFFIALAVESSILPIVMVMDEYRVYLPSAGIFMAVATGLALLLRNMKGSTRPMVYLVVLLIAGSVLTFATFRRNIVWATKESLWSDVIKKSPLMPGAHNNLANVFLGQGRLKEALKEYLRTIKLDPDSTGAHINICYAYRVLGFPDKAIEHCQLSLKLNPNSPKTYNNLGNAYAVKGLYGQAIENYLAALKLAPKYAEAHSNLGVAYMSTGKTEMALEEYKIALSIEPDYADAHSNLGNLYMTTKRTDDAIREYLAALQINPRHADANNNIGMAYFTKKMNDKAEEHFKKAYEINPSNSAPHLNLGRLYIVQKDFPKAEREFEEALRLNPGSVPARKYLEVLLKNRGG